MVSGTFVDVADVVIDPGHGGSEPGAVGHKGLAEKDVTLAVARLVVDDLRRDGISAVLTRTADYRMTLFSRATVARQLRARAFVSVHFNAEPDGPSTRPGSETYYQLASPSSKRLAGLLYEEVVGTLSSKVVRWQADRDAGVKYRRNDAGGDYYGLLRHSAGIATSLTESAFISNPPEEALLASTPFRVELAGALTRGIVRFLRSNDAGSGFVKPYDRDGTIGGADTVPSSCKDPAL